MKVLYICPYAHYSGHPPWAAVHEPDMLKQSGVDVTLLTTCGLIKGMNPKVKEIRAIPESVNKILNPLRSNTLTRWVFMVFETMWVLGKAVRLRKEYDAFYLRDGEPYLFMSHLVS